jgi:hypothetical protein
VKPYIADNRRRDRQAATAAANENYIYLMLLREAGWHWYSSWSAGQAKVWHIYHPCVERGKEIQHVSLEVAATYAMHAMHQQLDCYHQPKPQAPPTVPLWQKRLKYYADDAMPHMLFIGIVWFCVWALVEYLVNREDGE